MSGSVFLDTNILVYAHTDIDAAKQTIAQGLITNNHSFISTQVLQELIPPSPKGGKKSPSCLFCKYIRKNVYC